MPLELPLPGTGLLNQQRATHAVMNCALPSDWTSTKVMQAVQNRATSVFGLPAGGLTPVVSMAAETAVLLPDGTASLNVSGQKVCAALSA